MARRKYSRRYRGGSSFPVPADAPNPSTYTSGASYGMAVNGTESQQYNRVFSQSGPDATYQSNAIIGLQGQRAGKRARSYRNGGSRRKRGGLWGHVINQAIVPFGLLGMQQTYRRKKGGSHKKRTHRRRKY